MAKNLLAPQCKDGAPVSYTHLDVYKRQRLLFSRDRHLCAYCGEEFAESELTRDHIIPRSQNGKDTWENCVTACRDCNLDKAGRTPEQAGIRLLYVPYRPVKSEKLILANRHILADQMEYLQALAKTHKKMMRAA